ncbi:unnamed protein product [Boreogadus saida]
MASSKQFFSLFDGCLQHNPEDGLREVRIFQDQAAVVEPTSNAVLSEKGEREPPLMSDGQDKMVCTTCRLPLNNREEQMEHYKLDWHRFNLKQRVTGLPPVTVEEFEKKTGAGDMSSISGSDSDSEDEEEEEEDGDWPRRDITVPGADDDDEDSWARSGRNSTQLAFQNSEGQYLVVQRCVLMGKSVEGEVDVVDRLKAVTAQTVWVVLMTGGGHFAGAVYRGKEVVQHKTFHRYTVRAKRGTAQGVRDARGNAPKSAGAALRRYNEAALLKDIQELLESWAELLQEASAIFLRAPSYNKTIFCGKDAPLDKKDPRIRTVPFATRRATFREVQRVHRLLSSVQVFEKDTDLSLIFSPSKKHWKKKSTEKSNSSEEKEEEAESSDDEDELGESILETVEVALGTLHLREYEVHPSRHRKKRRKKKEANKMDDEELNLMEAGEKLMDEEEEEEEEEVVLQTAPPEDTSEEMPTKNKAKRKAKSKKKPVEEPPDSVAESWEYGLRDGLFTACKTGDVDGLLRLLHPPGQVEVEVEGGTSEVERRGTSEPPSAALALVNKPLDASGFTLLHVSSAAGRRAVVQVLMDAGADPACRDNKGQTPYLVAPEKDTRNVFRKYMADNPDKYDYSKAQVPGPLTEEIELKQTERKKAQKAAKKQRDKEQKEEKRKLEQEVEEKKRFASLTDREKRALAAEKRFAVQAAAATGANLSNIKRCWQCGESVLGKVPFQYLDFTFCTPRCVQAHRKAAAAATTSAPAKTTT